ncbi:MAG: extracellular solute-binding protein [Acholeplasmataceae bacterium]|nr:extracellular solute-binding protein [Acholeplasmataceae bacterium]
MLKKAWIVLILTMIGLIGYTDQVAYAQEDPEIADLTLENNYSTVYAQWLSEGLRNDIEFLGVVNPSDFLLNENQLTSDHQGYHRHVAKWDTQSSIIIPIEVAETGLYILGFDYYSLVDTIRPIGISVEINDVIQYYEASQITLDTFWESSDIIASDRYGNDIVPKSVQKHAWNHAFLSDTTGLYPLPMTFKLEAGVNQIKLNKTYGDMLLGDVTIKNQLEFMSYDSYLNENNHQEMATNQILKIEAEDIQLKNSPSIRAGTNRYPSVMPFALMESRLNVLDGTTYKSGKQFVEYEIEVPTAGFYHVTLKVFQSTNANTIAFRNIYINGEIPFEEAMHLPFPYNKQWQNVTLTSRDGEILAFYLNQGINTLRLEVDVSLYQTLHEVVTTTMAQINELALDIKKITGNNLDENRDWDITEYLPNLISDINQYAANIRYVYDVWIGIQGTTRASEVSSALKLAYERLELLSKEPDEIPKKMNVLSTGSGSVLAHLGNALPIMIQSPMTVDTIYVHGEDVDLPRANANFFYRIWVSVQRFFLSFFSDQYNDKISEDELEIWVNRSRQYVDMMQQMADSEYTPLTGQQVRISIMPNEDKLILANSSGNQPDLAMGVSAWRPYEFAVRDALLDLRSFDNFYDVADRFSEGSFLQLIYQDGIYALPETQNFQLLFYRKDIFNNLNIPVPDTWQDVLSILPELQRFGMNFYIPLASTSGFKSFDATMPIINQFQGRIYSDDAMSTAFDDPKTIAAVRFMTELFTLYSLPLEVGSFYNSFRYGTLPIGIGDFAMYVQLLHAAPEISGLWDIALIPGTKDPETNVVNRSFVGAATTAMIFKKGNKQTEAWEFLSWWTKSETQVLYAETLITTMGAEYMWNTANIEAFELLTWDERHKYVILEQWNWVSDVPKIPGSYMVERELSNIWNKVVYDGINVRTAIEDSAIIANKEIIRKMLEFGYIDNNNNTIRPYLLPTKETIGNWVNDHE